MIYVIISTMEVQKKTIFSGIQPSGNLHIGNYIGAIRQWINLQSQMSLLRQDFGGQANVKGQMSNYDLIFCIVDLHAITVPQDPKILRDKIRELAGLYIACGIDPKKCNIFIQSENPDHSYLTWIFDCITPMGWLERMTQFKDKVKSQAADVKSRASMGLFNYPVLQASDILLYDSDIVPVGGDQVQHIELARDIAKRFNSKFGDIFRLPKASVDKDTARIMSLSNPTNKMSKSDADQMGTINLLDSSDLIRKKISRAVTDSNPVIDSRRYRASFEPDGVSNLIQIYASFKKISFLKALDELEGRSYADFKKDLSEVIVEELESIQQKYRKIRSDSQYLDSVLDQGLESIRKKSSAKIRLVKEITGLGRI